MRAAAALGALWLAGCSGVGEQVPGDGSLVVVEFDDAFWGHYLPGTPTTEAEAVQQGIRFWNGLGANLHSNYEDLNPEKARYAQHYRINRDDYSWPGIYGGGPTGVTWPGCGASTIYPSVLKALGRYDFASLRSTVAHEVGHAIGLRHVDAYADMNPGGIWPAPYPAAGDVAEYCRAYPEAAACASR